MPKKIRELIRALQEAGFRDVVGEKGSHRKLLYPDSSDKIILSGNLGDDAKPYQEKLVNQAIEDSKK